MQLVASYRESRLSFNFLGFGSKDAGGGEGGCASTWLCCRWLASLWPGVQGFTCKLPACTLECTATCLLL